MRSHHVVASKAIVFVALLLVSTTDAQSDVLYEGTPPPEIYGNWSAFSYSSDELANADDWYIADHPYLNMMDKVRAPNGSWVTNPNYTLAPFTSDEFNGNLTARIPWYIRWYATESTNSLHKTFANGKKVFMYNLVSPMDWGLSPRSVRHRKEYHEALAHWWYDLAGKFILKKLARSIHDFFFLGIQKEVQEKLFWRNFHTMNVSEFGAWLNMSKAEIDQLKENAANKMQINYTLPWKYELPTDLGGDVPHTIPEIGERVTYFKPYPEYYLQYYNAHGESSLPPPTLPAATKYPWQWHERITLTRLVLWKMLQVEAAKPTKFNMTEMEQGDGNNSSGGGEEATTAPQQQRRLMDSSHGGSGTGQAGDGGEAKRWQAQEAMRLIAQQIHEYHFSTGIPRLHSSMMRDHWSPVLFPPRNEFLNATMNGNLSWAAQNLVLEPQAGDPQHPVDSSRLKAKHHKPVKTAEVLLEVDFSAHEGVYAAATAFYTLATVETNYIKKLDNYKPPTPPPATLPPIPGHFQLETLTVAPPRAEMEYANCSALAPCLAYSAVTVYTPALAQAVRELFTSASTALLKPDAQQKQKQRRLEWFQHMISTAFQAEEQVLNTGLVAPSTVWYSFFDREVDMFGDSVLARVNATKLQTLAAGEATHLPLTVYEALAVSPKSPLVKAFWYYSLTNIDTRKALAADEGGRQSGVSKLVALEDKEIWMLVDFVWKWMNDLALVIDKYKSKRDSDPMHKAMVNATTEQIFYDGRPYGLLGFGYLLPSTNAGNVAFRDHRLPEPFHLVVRLMVRFQESRLLLPEESRQIVACLAMRRFDIKFYRCMDMTGEQAGTNETADSTETPSSPTTAPPPTAAAPPPASQRVNATEDIEPPMSENENDSSTSSSGGSGSEADEAPAVTETPSPQPRSAALVWS